MIRVLPAVADNCRFQNNTMKNIIKLIAVATALLPLGQLQAKTFGGFTPKETFNLTVTTKFVARSSPIKGAPSVVVPVPKGIVKLSVGETVKFTIGAKGQLLVKGFDVPFRSASPDLTFVVYGNQPSKPTAQSKRNISNCLIVKNLEEGPTIGELKFYQTNGRGLKETTTVVVYELKKK